MTNQWGRDSQVPSSRGIGGTIVAVIVALSLGAAASYGYMRYVRPDVSLQLVAAREEAQVLRTALDEAQAKLGRSDEALARANDALAEANEARAKADAALKQLQVAEASRDPEIASLRQRLAAQSGELDVLTEKLAASSEAQAGGAADRQALEQRLAGELQQARSQLQQAQDIASAIEAEKRRLEADLAEQRNGLQNSASATERELADLKQNTIPGLRAEIGRLEQQVNALASEKADIQMRFDALQLRADAERNARTKLDGQLREAQERVTGLERQLATQPAATAAPQTGSGSVATPPVVAPPEKPAPEPPAQSSRPQRNALQVDSALNRAPGLDKLTAAQAAELKSALLAGACVTNALEDAFDRVPVITLRNLIRDLKSDC